MDSDSDIFPQTQRYIISNIFTERIIHINDSDVQFSSLFILHNTYLQFYNYGKITSYYELTIQHFTNSYK